jgi:hypothetical protein
MYALRAEPPKHRRSVAGTNRLWGVVRYVALNRVGTEPVLVALPHIRATRDISRNHERFRVALALTAEGMHWT